MMNRNVTSAAGRKRIGGAVSLLLFCAAAAFGSNMANPTAQIQDARLSIGASYGINGVTITDSTIPMLQNRLCLRVSFAPVRYVNIGLDGGMIIADVDRYLVPGEEYFDTNGLPRQIKDTIPAFESNVGWIFGGHLKLSTPYLLEYVSLFGLANGNFFRAKNDFGAYYGGKEGIGIVGAQVRVPGFGFISAGPQVHLIMGENKSYDGIKSKYNNKNNVRGWIAIDYFPDMKGLTGNTTPYTSLEFSMSPKIGGSKRVPVQEFGLSISVGAITNRLYGADKDALDF